MEITRKSKKEHGSLERAPQLYNLYKGREARSPRNSESDLLTLTASVYTAVVIPTVCQMGIGYRRFIGNSG